MNGVYLITGGNLGNRTENLHQAAMQIIARVGLITAKSLLYETDAWGKEDTPAYLNQVLAVSTPLNAQQLMQACLQIESDMGRIRDEKWASRIIDIDILFYNDDIVSLPNLQIPHPRIAERRFVLEPLCELAADEIHPVSGLSIRELWQRCKDPLAARIFL